MTGAAFLLLTALLVLTATYLPGFLAVRALAGSRALALGIAPAVSASIAGIAAMIAPLVGIDWSLLPFAAAAAVVVLAALLLGRCGVRLPPTVLDGPPPVPRSRTALAAWTGLLTAALAVAVVPIAVRAGRADAVLERYDTLYHLSALKHIRDTGNASSLELNAVASSAHTPASYPAAFHDLAALVPGVPIPIVLNGAVLALALVPWILGSALLARAVFPRVRWAPPAVAVLVTLIPASPVDLWIHLSPVPNLVGFAALPGALAAAAALWSAVTVRPRAAAAPDPAAPDPAAPDGAAAAPPWRGILAAVGTVGLAGVGLALLHPNAAVTALILLAVVTAVTGAPLWRRQPWLIAVPVLALLPVAVLTYTPLGARVTGFSGGLQVPWWAALAEVGLGLLTVWPMALGAVIAVLWWPGLVTTLRTPQRWLSVAWLVIAVMYLDAAVDSPLDLSVLYFRGQDRLAVPLAMLSALLVVPGLQAWARLLRRTPSLRTVRRRRGAAAALVALAVLAALSSIPTRLDDAAKNLSEDYPGRGRFLQSDELAEFARIAPQLADGTSILASPYSGAAHMYALHGLSVRLPVAGMALTDADRAAIEAVPLAGASPEHCRALVDEGIGYVYQEQRLYQFDPAFVPIGQGGDDLGTVVFETDHSRLIRVECDTGR